MACIQNESNLIMAKLYQRFKKLLRPSVTRLGDLLDFGHLFKAFGSN